jgi:hypothetical protein
VLSTRKLPGVEKSKVILSCQPKPISQTCGLESRTERNSGRRLQICLGVIRGECHDRVLLEFVPSPQGPVIQVAAGLGFFQKASGVEDSVVCLKPEMAVRLPSHCGAGPVSNESCATSVGGPDQESGNCVNTVIEALATGRSNRLAEWLVRQGFFARTHLKSTRRAIMQQPFSRVTLSKCEGDNKGCGQVCRSVMRGVMS